MTDDKLPDNASLAADLGSRKRRHNESSDPASESPPPLQPMPPPQNPSLPLPHQPSCQGVDIDTGRSCAVCGDYAEQAGGDPVCCDSCKAFFRRSIGREHTCSQGDNACELTVETRKQCRACRFRLCLEAGLKLNSPPSPQHHQASAASLGSAPNAVTAKLEHEVPPEKRYRSGSFDDAGCSSGSRGAFSSAFSEMEIPTKPVPNWKDALLKVANYYGEDRTPVEADFIVKIGDLIKDCTSSDMSVPFSLNHDLNRGLSEHLENWNEMIYQLEIFIQPAIRFCKTFMTSDFFKQSLGWRPEHSVLLVKLRIHAILVPLFSVKFDTNSREMSVSIDGKTYSVDPNRSIRNLDRSFAPGLSAVTANDRYFEYVHKVTGGDMSLVALFTLMKLFDLSMVESDDLPEEMERLAFDVFMRLAKCTRHAFVAKFDDRWQAKMREMCILFEWSKTFDESLSKLFSSISSQSPTPLFAEIYT